MEAGLLFIFHMAKMGLKISEGNAPMYRSYKSRFGTASFLKQTDVCYHNTSTFICIENVNDNTQMAQPSRLYAIFARFSY